MDGLLLINFYFFLSSFRMGLAKPSRALVRFLLRLTSLMLLTLCGIPLFSTNLFWLAFHVALFAGINLAFLIGALAWLFKITKVVPFEMFRKDPFLALHFSLFSLITFLLHCLLTSAVLVLLSIWSSSPSVLPAVEASDGVTRSSDLTGTLV